MPLAVPGHKLLLFGGSSSPWPFGGASVGSPGSLPTGWAVNPANGLTTAVNGMGVSQRVPYIDLGISGTTSGTFYELLLSLNTALGAVNGQTWRVSPYLALSGGATTNLTLIGAGYNENNSGGTAITAHGIGNVVSTINGTLTRLSGSATNSNVSTAFVAPYITLNFGNGVAVNIVLRVGLVLPAFNLVT